MPSPPLLLHFLLLLFFFFFSSPFLIATHSQATPLSSFTITLSPNASNVDFYAAKQLSHFLTLAQGKNGTVIPIANFSSSLSHQLAVGADACLKLNKSLNLYDLGDEGYLVQSVNSGNDGGDSRYIHTFSLFLSLSLTHIHTYKHTHIHTHTHTYTHTHTHTRRTYSHTQKDLHTHTNSLTHSSSLSRTHTYPIVLLISPLSCISTAKEGVYNSL